MEMRGCGGFRGENISRSPEITEEALLSVDRPSPTHTCDRGQGAGRGKRRGAVGVGRMAGTSTSRRLCWKNLLLLLLRTAVVQRRHDSAHGFALSSIAGSVHVAFNRNPRFPARPHNSRGTAALRMLVAPESVCVCMRWRTA